MTTHQETISTVDYNENTFCVFGNGTKRYKEQLKQLGGKWNPYLKDQDGNRFKAWIFHKKREKDVKNFLNIAMQKNQYENGIDTQSSSNELEEYEEYEDYENRHPESEYEEFNSNYEREMLSMKKHIRRLESQVKKLKRKVEPKAQTPPKKDRSFFSKLQSGFYIASVAILTVSIVSIFMPNVFPSFQKIINNS